MDITDFLIAILGGIISAWLATDFFGMHYALLFYLFLPLWSVFLLWAASLFKGKWKFINQAARFSLSGGIADAIDIKSYQFIFLFFPFSIAVKSVSFVIAVIIKYIANKFWVFHKFEKQGIREIIHFLAITLVGLGINVTTFYLITVLKQDLITPRLWTELAIIFAAVVASVWNFLGYKFLVFKK